MPYVTQVAVGKLPQLNVFGNDYPTRDGTCIRDYIHVCDLARGHVLTLKKLESNPGLVIYNLGTSVGTTVLELVNAFMKANDIKIPYVIAPRRPGDIAECYANADKALKENIDIIDNIYYSILSEMNLDYLKNSNNKSTNINNNNGLN